MPQDQQFSTPSIRIGCSGWQYKHWRGSFYPTSLPQSRWLEYYARQFDTVEINNTFYRLPETPTFAAWGRRVPRGFIYAVKASRYLTHMKKLKVMPPRHGRIRLGQACHRAVRVPAVPRSPEILRALQRRLLKDWAEWCAVRARAGMPIYAYFNNDAGGHAPRDAASLREAIEARLGMDRREPRVLPVLP
jgi:uncharacterized protein YecE (DUF72 family)